MRKRLIAGVLASIAGVVMALAMTGPAGAAPAGAANNLSFGSCQSNGTVSGTLSWNPSGLGSQYVDLAVDSGFNNYSRGGPYASSASAVILTQLEHGHTYYARVATVTSSGTLFSDTAVISPDTCTGGGGGTGGITKPTNVTATALGTDSLHVDWTPGNNNIWYCVDTAHTLNHLYTTSNTWRNHGCWTTNSQLTVTGLHCGTTYYVLVYAWNATQNIKSDPTVAQTDSCQSTISKPTNLSATLLDGDDVLIDWSAGNGNIWYCVDLALSQNDLLNTRGSWANYGCWTTNTQLVVPDIECGERYYYLVYAWNNYANTKSNVSTFDSHDCEAELEEAPIVDLDVVDTGAGYRADIVAALPDGCHSPDSHRVQRSGDEVIITVWNSVVPGPCTLIYSEYELNINLGTDFDEGQEYEVIVNGEESETFIAD